MIVSTIFKEEFLPEGFLYNRFAGNFYDNDVPTDRQAVNTFYSGAFNIPILVDDIWVEGAAEAQLLEIQINIISEYRLKIYDYTEKLFNSSKAGALNKVGQGLTKPQLDALEIFYIKKNEVATQYLIDETIVNESIFELIQFEESNDFTGVKLDNEVAYLNSNYNAQIPTNETRLKQYCYLIKVKFSLGSQLNELLKSFCEIFRSKLITNLDNLEFEKIDQRIALIQTITNEMTVSQILDLKTPFDAI